LPKTLKEDNKELIRDLFDRMETALLQFIRKGGFKVSDPWRPFWTGAHNLLGTGHKVTARVGRRK
jgi:hypothetical protein